MENIQEKTVVFKVSHCEKISLFPMAAKAKVTLMRRHLEESGNWEKGSIWLDLAHLYKFSQALSGFLAFDSNEVRGGRACLHGSQGEYLIIKSECPEGILLFIASNKKDEPGKVKVYLDGREIQLFQQLIEATISNIGYLKEQ